VTQQESEGLLNLVDLAGVCEREREILQVRERERERKREREREQLYRISKAARGSSIS
jgi:hypothetical protein